MTSKKNSLYRRLLGHVKPYWRIFTLAIAAMVINAITEPAMPALLKPLLDEGFIAQNTLYIQWMPLLLMGIIFIKGIAMLVTTVGMTWIASRLVTDLRVSMFERVLTLPTRTFDNLSAGVLLSKITYDVTRVMEASTEALIILVRDSITVLGLLLLMFYLNWLLSLVIFTVLPFIIIIVRLISRHLRHTNTRLQEAMGNVTRVLEESISGHKLIKVFGGQTYERQRFQAATDQVRHLEVKAQTLSGFSVFIIQLLTAAALSIIIYVAAQQSIADQMTVGDFVSLFTAMGMLFAPVKRLTKVNDQLQKGLAAAASVFELIDQPPEVDNGQQAIQRLSGRIEFCHVNFAYEADKPALHDISLHIAAGETVALVGMSGSGKTTLANLLPRFYPLSDGQLLLDDIDVNHLPLPALRNNIALVSQDVVLFNDSLAANIAYGCMIDATQAQIHAAAEAAFALEFIEQMPEGLDTLVGERGVKLSGGQRQRIAIARALLKDAPILIFDEATSALDARSEQAVQQSLEHLKQGRTTLIIAHRLSTIARADRIVVMDHGRIVESGTHQQLITCNGAYAALYRVQQKGEAKDEQDSSSSSDAVLAVVNRDTGR